MATTWHLEMKNHLQNYVGDLFTDYWSHCVLWPNPLLALLLVMWGKYHGCCILGTFPSARHSLGSQGQWVNSLSVLWIQCLDVGSGVRVFIMLYTLSPPLATVMMSNPEARHRSLHSPPALDLLPDGVRVSLFHSTGSLWVPTLYPALSQNRRKEVSRNFGIIQMKLSSDNNNYNISYLLSTYFVLSTLLGTLEFILPKTLSCMSTVIPILLLMKIKQVKKLAPDSTPGQVVELDFKPTTIDSYYLW